MDIRLKEARTNKAMSTRELARRSGVARSYIQKIEAGEANPTINTLRKLAETLDVSVAALVSEDGGRAE